MERLRIVMTNPPPVSWMRFQLGTPAKAAGAVQFVAPFHNVFSSLSASCFRKIREPFHCSFRGTVPAL